MHDVDNNNGPNLDNLDGLTTGQRAALALDLVPGFMEEAKERRYSPKPGRGRPQSETGKAAARAALAVGVGRTSVETAIAIQKRDKSIIERLRSGELNIAQAARAVGFYTGPGLGRGDGTARDSAGRSMPATYYGKGDKWKEAIGPVLRYLNAWEKRGFEFRHVAPKEARRRLALIEELEKKLDAARADLEQRAHSATLSLSTTRKG